MIIEEKQTYSLIEHVGWNVDHLPNNALILYIPNDDISIGTTTETKFSIS